MDGANRNKAAFRSMLKAGMPKREERVDHPLARYDDSGRIECKVCKKAVETKGRWIAHLASKDHHENVSRLKAQLQGGGGKGRGAVPERSPPVLANPGLARPASTLPSDFFDDRKAKQAREDRVSMPPPPMRPAGQSTQRKVASSGALAGGSVPQESTLLAGSSREARGEDEVREVARSALPAGKGVLPAGFFDDMAEEQEARRSSGNASEQHTRGDGGGRGAAAPSPPAGASVKLPAGAPGALPEGFFDDEIADKKARGVEVPKRDPAEEYREFQRSIQSELEAAEKFQEEDEIVAAEEREGRMAIENREFARKIAELQRIKEEKKAAATANKPKIRGIEDEDEEEEEEEDDEEEDSIVLDWRAKKT